MILGTQYAVAFFLIEKTSSFYDLGLLATIISTLLIAAAGYGINDYYDIKIDLINKPERVVVGTKLKRRPVLLTQICLNGLGLVLGILVSWKIGLINAVSILLLWSYSNRLKRMPFIGNLTIGILTGLSLLIIGVYFGSYSQNLFIYSFFAAVVTLVREIIKDLEDLKGDKAHDCQTLPILFGVSKTKLIIYFIVSIFLAVVFYFLITANSRLVWFYFLILIVPFTHFMILLYRSDTVKRFSHLSLYAKFIMILGILSMPLL